MKIKDYSMILEIEQKREEMYKSMAENGITHQNTLQISQELDRLLNIIQITRNPKETLAVKNFKQ